MYEYVLLQLFFLSITGNFVPNPNELCNKKFTRGAWMKLVFYYLFVYSQNYMKEHLWLGFYFSRKYHVAIKFRLVILKKYSAFFIALHIIIADLYLNKNLKSKLLVIKTFLFQIFEYIIILLIIYLRTIILIWYIYTYI